VIKLIKDISTRLEDDPKISKRALPKGVIACCMKKKLSLIAITKPEVLKETHQNSRVVSF
jgi:hypothetical protein